MSLQQRILQSKEVWSVNNVSTYSTPLALNESLEVQKTFIDASFLNQEEDNEGIRESNSPGYLPEFPCYQIRIHD